MRRWTQGFRNGLGTDKHPVRTTGSGHEPELRVEGPAGIGSCVHHDRSDRRPLITGVQDTLESIDEQHLAEAAAVKRAVQRQFRQQRRWNGVGHSSPDTAGCLGPGDSMCAQRVVGDHRYAAALVSEPDEGLGDAGSSGDRGVVAQPAVEIWLTAIKAAQVVDGRVQRYRDERGASRHDEPYAGAGRLP